MSDRMKAGWYMLLFLTAMSATIVFLLVGARYHDGRLFLYAGGAYLISCIPGVMLLKLVHDTEPDE